MFPLHLLILCLVMVRNELEQELYCHWWTTLMLIFLYSMVTSNQTFDTTLYLSKKSNDSLFMTHKYESYL